MPLGKFMKSGGLAALAAGLAFAALPSSASAAPGDNNGRGQWGQRGDDNDRGNRGGETRGRDRSEQRAAQPQAQPQPRAERSQGQQARNPGGDRNGAERGRGWGSQRAAEGQRYGRDWNNGGTVNRPAPAVRNRAPEVQAPARAYSDRNRNGTYTTRQQTQQQGWNGQRWTGQTWDRNGDGRPDGDRTWNRDGRRDGNRDWNRDGRRDGNRDWNRDGRRWDGDRSGNWSRDWRRDNRYNWQGWRSSNRDVFRLGRYHPPYRSYNYRRLSLGFHLDSMFFGSNYWINDPWQYRLPAAYGPYRWVRYYDDALLVNIYDGEVVDVLYDFFW